MPFRAIPWVLVVPQPNGAPSEFIPYTQVAEIAKMLDMTNKKPENVSVPMSPTAVPPEKISEVMKEQKKEPITTPASTPPTTTKKVNTLAFLQEDEDVTKTEMPSTTTKEKTETTTTQRQTTRGHVEEHEIVLNGKKYKLVMDETTQSSVPTTTAPAISPFRIVEPNVVPSEFPKDVCPSH